ncbi:MAG: copper amine oxidase N-terminal domain-containing protein [Defluviitaleaceae bacterium]|nr:copper amine oxidase N-terminal domain-containing protein [Defluviitaleaceae bacterium]
MTTLKSNSAGILRGIFFAAFFAVFSVGLFFVNAYANNGDSSPGSLYILIPGNSPQTVFQQPHPLPACPTVDAPDYLPFYELGDAPFFQTLQSERQAERQPEWRSEMLGERELTRRQEGLDILGTIPDIDDAFSSASCLNEYISDNIVSSLVSEARRIRARSVTFRHEYRPSEYMVSLVIYADVLTTLPHTLVRSVNFCTYSGQLISMNEAVGLEITPLAERILAEMVRRNPEHYYAALSSPITERAFYFSEGQLVILFDGFRLSTRIGEVQSVELSPDSIKMVVLSPDEFRTDGPYGLKMIPLRAMLEGRLGFEMEWIELERRAVVRRNGTSLIEMHDGDNEYIVFGTQRRSLEVAPQIMGGRLHVPITFFDQILPLTTFSIEPDGSITFLSYIG